MDERTKVVDLIPDEREIVVAIIDALDDVKKAQEECMWIKVPKGQVWASGNCHDLANRMRDAFGMKTNTKGGVPLDPAYEAPLKFQVAAWLGLHRDDMPCHAVEGLQSILKAAPDPGDALHRKVAIVLQQGQPEFRCYKCGTPARMTEDTIDCVSHAENGRFCSFDCGHFLCEHCEGTPNCGDAEELGRRLGSISIRVDPVIGTDPERVCADAAGMSERLGVMVEFTLNGIYMVTVPGHTPRKLYEEFKKRAAK